MGALEAGMEDRWLAVDDIRKYLNVGDEVVYKWIGRRGMPGHRVGCRWVFRQEGVDDRARFGGASCKVGKLARER